MSCFMKLRGLVGTGPLIIPGAVESLVNPKKI
jgi:hypothetical protein